MRVRKEDFGGQLSPVELHSDTVCIWAVSPHYSVVNGMIIPQVDTQTRLTFPLSDPNLFLSFARLGSHGEPSEKSILRWVRARGLLKGRDRLRESDFAGATAFGPLLEQHERIEQHPVSVDEFRKEVRSARQMLRLYADVRGRDYEAIAEWFLPETPQTPRAPAQSTMVEKYLDHWRNSEYDSVRWMLQQGMTTRRSESEWLIGTAKSALLGAVAYSVRDIRLTLTDLRAPGNQGRNPLYARRTMQCPDLLSALYLQFYLLVTDNKPMRHCENPACGMSFPAKPKHKRFCNASCRSNARNYR